MSKILVVILACVLMFGCSTQELKSYVDADKATFNAMSQEYLSLVNSAKDDAGKDRFDADQKDRRKNLVDTWKLRIENAEKGVVLSQPAPSVK